MHTSENAFRSTLQKPNLVALGPKCLYRVCSSLIFKSTSLRTYQELTAAGVPCTVVLDSAVSYVMDKVDFVLVGSEAVVESGGLINAVGSNQIAIIAKAANIPFYALAER